jgi:hypothetical protein
MAAGKVPTEVTPYLCGGNLFASIKKSGGHRPVAVGDILRRLTSKSIAYAVAGRASDHLRPLQFGVGVRGGCEGVVHATRATLEDETIPQNRKWLLQTDLVNGFNQVDRTHMLAEVRNHFPDISHWIEASYGEESLLNFGGGSIRSKSGVHQGDPLAPLLFSLTLHPVVQQLEEQVPNLSQNSWFLDDGVLVGTQEALTAAWDILLVEGRPRGLIPSGEKSLVLCLGHDSRDTDPLGRGVTRTEDRGTKLLGAPFGDHELEAEILEERLTSVKSLLEKLHLLEDPHMEYTLLRSCFSFPKFSYALRTVDCTKHGEILKNFDLAVKETLEATLGAPLPPAQWAQASLPTQHGGLGLRSAAAHGAAAYLASVGAVASLVQEIRKLEELPAPEVKDLMTSLNNQLGDPLSHEEVALMTQRSLSALIDTHSSNTLHQREDLTVRDKARLRGVEREGAADWLNVIPSKALGLHLRRGEFIFAVRYRLGMRVFESEGECPMPHCRAHSDKEGDHAIGCAINGERISRHNHIRDALFNAAAQATLGPVKEPDGLLTGSDDRPADILIPYWTQGRSTALDVSVISPLQAAQVERCALDGGKAVESRYTEKMRKYHGRCEREGLTFIPMVVDTLGGWHPAALQVITKLGRQVARAVGKEEGETVRQLRQRLAVLLVRDNMAMLNSRAPTFPASQLDGDVDQDEI